MADPAAPTKSIINPIVFMASKPFKPNNLQRFNATAIFGGLG